MRISLICIRKPLNKFVTLRVKGLEEIEDEVDGQKRDVEGGAIPPKGKFSNGFALPTELLTWRFI